MAFEGLSEKLQNTFKKLTGKGILSEKDIDEAMREVRMALLEADVNYKVVKEFVAEVKSKSMGADVMESLTPGQQVIKIVRDQLVDMMGEVNSKLTYSSRGFTVYLMVGLQGTGKTTTCGKLAAHLLKNGKKPMLCACDVYRPAAIEQLETIGSQVGVPVFALKDNKNPVEIVKAAEHDAQVRGYNVLIVDTAGRLQIDDALMQELCDIKKEIRPHEILLVVDAMTGQDAVNVAQGFDSALGIDGIIMTKLDGDTRGGAALSTKKVTGKPIKFIGVGEKSDALEEFHPDRMAGRILGMGDMLSLIEKAEETMDEKKAMELEERIRKNSFTLEDFLDQMAQIKKMGGIAKILDMLPGMGMKTQDVDFEQGNQELKEMEAIILSMTRAERNDPSILNASRRKRISMGSGQPVSKINTLVKRYADTKKMMKQFTGGRGRGKLNNLFRGMN